MNICINMTPEGATSLYYREALIGLGLALVPDEVLEKNPPTHHDVFFSTEEGGYVVLRSEVINALDQIGRHDVAEFWGRMGAAHYMIFSAIGCTPC